MKKMISLITVMVLCLSCFITSEYKVKASVNYDRQKALAYFAEHVYDKDGKLCAEGVSDAIEHGGISRSIAWSKGASTLYRQLTASGLGTSYKLTLNSDKSISVSKCTGKLEPGDLIFYYCSGCTDGNPYIHVVMFKEADGNGYAKCYSRNNSNNASKKYYYSKYCYGCGHEIKTAYVFHFNTEESDNKKKEVKQLIPNDWYKISSAVDPSGKSVLNICGNSSENGANLIIYPWENTDNEIFWVEYQGNGYYSIMAKHSGKYIHVQDNKVYVNCHQWENLHDNSLWELQETGQGSYYLKNKNGGGYLDLSGADITACTNVQSYAFNSTNAQKWFFTPVQPKNQCPVNCMSASLQDKEIYISKNFNVSLFSMDTSVPSTKIAADSAYSLYTGKIYRNTKLVNGGCTWKDPNGSIFQIGYKDASKEKKLSVMYELLMKGVPVILRLGDTPGISLTVIGVRAEADASSLKYQDFVVFYPYAPGFGFLSDMAQTSDWYNGQIDNNGWSLIVPYTGTLFNGFKVK